MPKKRKKKSRRSKQANDYQENLNNINKVIVGATSAGVLLSVGSAAVKAFK